MILYIVYPLILVYQLWYNYIVYPLWYNYMVSIISLFFLSYLIEGYGNGHRYHSIYRENLDI